MLVINADDWGGWKSATDAALASHRKGRITSVSAMVFMADSARAAEIAISSGMDVGLHVNFTHDFSGGNCPGAVADSQKRLCRFLKRNKYALLFYQPALTRAFRQVYEAQVQEFHCLYSRAPSHIDGHQHMHLATNMLLDRIIPAGEKVRRNFSFWPGEKGLANRNYRRLVDRFLAGRYLVTDHFFALSQCLNGNRLAFINRLARSANVELMTHPEKPAEYDCLMSEPLVFDVRTGTDATFESRQ